MVKRPIPFWKDFGIKTANIVRKSGIAIDTIIAQLPYNMQMTPIIGLSDNTGNNLISICTDHLHGGGETNNRAEYITKKGAQSYESLGWLSGQQIILTLPKSVIINSIKYRETGYDTYPAGSFSCDDDFFMRFWQKGLRTLYVNMRDTYFDCPDRERAQWWGDVTVLSGECFYTYSTSTHALMRKAINELCGWQRTDGSLYSPIPSGNYDSELPGQMLASIGKYGFWNYYLNTGDRKTLENTYPSVKKYLSLWTTDSTGLTVFRHGGWPWGDWGYQKDMRLIFAGMHYLALQGAEKMATELGINDDANHYKSEMQKVKNGYNKCWNGYAYRHPEYQGETDDRVQALAVITGIASSDKYPQILNLLKTQWHASPYMEKYVMEALFQMGYGDFAIERVKKRFAPMVNDSIQTTLFEGWDIGNSAFGGGTTNHAWSGGPLTVIAQYLCGISPVEPGYKTFAINPQPASFKKASISVPTVAGNISSDWKYINDKLMWRISIPRSTSAYVSIPSKSLEDILINKKHPSMLIEQKVANKTTVLLPAGDYEIIVNNPYK